MPALDALIHQPVRLRIMAALTSLGAREQVDFSFLKDKLALTDGTILLGAEQVATDFHGKVGPGFKVAFGFDGIGFERPISDIHAAKRVFLAGNDNASIVAADPTEIVLVNVVADETAEADTD